MKLGETKRRIVCKECRKHIGWVKDIIIEGDLDSILLGIPIFCVDCIE